MANNPSQTQPVFQTADVPAGSTVTPASDIPKPKTIKKEENQMADVDTQYLANQHSDIRREAVEHTLGTRADIKDARFDVASRLEAAHFDLSKQVDAIDDTLTAQLFNMTRDGVDSRVQITGLGYQVRDGFAQAAKDAEINALKTQIELAKQTTYISDKIDAGNQRTTDLIQALRDSDQNRMLVERNTELVAALNDGRWGRDWGHFRGNWDTNQQFVSSRLNSLDSQLQDTRQGMVNFGTMAGVGQTSTSNNVK